MSELPQFVPSPKIPRWSRNIVITEKIDGTNAVVYVREDRDENFRTVQVIAGSKSRWITPKNDNFGFAKWVEANKGELLSLGPGLHHGEWWGNGINRGYGLPNGDKRFSLFNTSKWGYKGTGVRPPCCDVVPILYEGMMSEPNIVLCLEKLRFGGSVAVPGFMNPEGIVVFHTQGNLMFKKTLENDEVPKSLVGEK